MTVPGNVLGGSAGEYERVSDRIAHLRIKARKGHTVTGLKVTTEGVRATVVRKARGDWVATIDLRGLPRGCYTVRVTARVNGRKMTHAHIYRVAYGDPKAGLKDGTQLPTRSCAL